MNPSQNDEPVDEQIPDVPPGFQPQTNPVQMLVNLLQQGFQANPGSSSSSQNFKPSIAFKSFKALQPPEFKGTVNPVERRLRKLLR